MTTLASQALRAGHYLDWSNVSFFFKIALEVKANL